MARYSFEIGVSAETTVNLEELEVPLIPPAWSYTEYSSEIRLANGKVRGMGFPVATWHWDVLGADEREVLRTFCSGKSAEVFIRTPVNEHTENEEDELELEYRLFQAVMVWPAGESPTVRVYPDFTLEFRHLIEIEEESV